MPEQRRRQFLIPSSLLCFGLSLATVIGLDQSTKWWAQSQSWVVHNVGFSFSVGQNLSASLNMGIVIVVLAFLGIAARQVWQNHPISTGLITGGAISNLVDRWWWGGVRDWWSWPVFGFKNNLADVAIFGGVIGLIMASWWHDRQVNKAASQNLVQSSPHVTHADHT